MNDFKELLTVLEERKPRLFFCFVTVVLMLTQYVQLTLYKGLLKRFIPMSLLKLGDPKASINHPNSFLNTCP